MKKILTILLTLLTILTISGCQKSEDYGSLPAEQRAKDEEYLIGDYQDKVGQRATMTITLNEDNTYNLVVDWPSDASTVKRFTMTNAAFDKENNKITYRGETIEDIVYDEQGNESSQNMTMANNIGYFELKDKNLLWTGAAQEECRTCEFEKISLI